MRLHRGGQNIYHIGFEGTVTVRQGQSVDPYAAYAVYDTFTDTNGVHLHDHIPEKAPVGAAWAEMIGGNQFTIQGNAANCTGGNDAGIIIESGLGDCTIKVVSFTIDKNNGLLGRCTTWMNGIMGQYSVANQRWEVYRLQAGYNLLASANEAHTKGDVVSNLSLVLSATSIILAVGGTTKVSTTSNFNQTATKHGLFGYAETGTAAWDTFTVA